MTGRIVVGPRGTANIRGGSWDSAVHYTQLAAFHRPRISDGDNDLAFRLVRRCRQ